MADPTARPATGATKPRRRTQERRRQLTALAGKLIGERGFDKLSVNELASDFGMSIGGVYRYINSKTDLLVMACEDIYGDLRERVADVAVGEQPIPEKLRGALAVYLESCWESRDLILLLYREYRYLPLDAQRRYMDREEAIAAIFADLIRGGIRNGLFRAVDADVLARDIILLGHLPSLKSWSLHGIAAPALLHRQIEIIVGGIVLPVREPPAS